MVTSFVISFRESLEVFLVLVPMVIYLIRMKKYRLARRISYGAGLGLISTALVSLLMFGQLENLEGLGRRIFDGGMHLFLSVLILLNIIQFIRQKKYLTKKPGDEDGEFLSGLGLFILSYATVFRESLEIIVYNLPALGEDTSTLVIGASLGITASLTLCLLVFGFSVNLNMKLIFFVLTALMIVIGADMFGEGISSLLPEGEGSVENAARLVYAIPLLYIFIKRELKTLIESSKKME